MVSYAVFKCPLKHGLGIPLWPLRGLYCGSTLLHYTRTLSTLSLLYYRLQERSRGDHCIRLNLLLRANQGLLVSLDWLRSRLMCVAPKSLFLLDFFEFHLTSCFYWIFLFLRGSRLSHCFYWGIFSLCFQCVSEEMRRGRRKRTRTERTQRFQEVSYFGKLFQFRGLTRREKYVTIKRLARRSGDWGQISATLYGIMLFSPSTPFSVSPSCISLYIQYTTFSTICQPLITFYFIFF